MWYLGNSSKHAPVCSLPCGQRAHATCSVHLQTQQGVKQQSDCSARRACSRRILLFQRTSPFRCCGIRPSVKCTHCVHQCKTAEAASSIEHSTRDTIAFWQTRLFKLRKCIYCTCTQRVRACTHTHVGCCCARHAACNHRLSSTWGRRLAPPKTEKRARRRDFALVAMTCAAHRPSSSDCTAPITPAAPKTNAQCSAAPLRACAASYLLGRPQLLQTKGGASTMAAALPLPLHRHNCCLPWWNTNCQCAAAAEAQVSAAQCRRRRNAGAATSAAAAACVSPLLASSLRRRRPAFFQLTLTRSPADGSAAEVSAAALQSGNACRYTTRLQKGYALLLLPVRLHAGTVH
jgi:hypothetical protein